jgi:hypothetical protein
MVNILLVPYVIRVAHDIACLRANGAQFVACTDPDLCTLVAAQNIAVGRYEAFCDGAIGTCTDVDAERVRLSRDYDSASNALIAFRRGRRGVRTEWLGDCMADHESF